MIPFKGRLAFKQRMPMKPVKNGMKPFSLCEARMGYSAVFLIYLGKETRGQEKGNDGELGKTGAVVVNLVKEYKHKGYKLYIDNFYTSVPLLSYLF